MRKLRSEIGTYLLEFSAVLAALLPVILGAIDINNALHAYSAVRASVSTGLRCLYPVDGRCVDTSGFSQATRLYDWYRGSRDTSYFVRRANYAGDAFWLESPRYTYTDYRAQILRDVAFDLEQFSFNILVGRGQIRSQELRTIVQTAELPYIAGSDPHNPSFRYLNNRSEDYGTRIHAPASGSSLLDASNNEVRIAIRLEAPQQQFGFPRGARCDRSLAFDRGSLGDGTEHHSSFSGKCVASDTGDTVPVIVWVKGTARGGRVGVTSKVGMRLRSPNRDLGGQAFGNPGGSNASRENFYPRGFGTRHGYTDPDFGSPPEFQHEVEVKYGTTAELVLFKDTSLGAWDPSLSFTIDDVQLFPPEFSAEQFTASCSVGGCAAAAGSTSCQLRYEGKSFGAPANTIPIAEGSGPVPNAVSAAGAAVTSAQNAGTEQAFGTFFSEGHAQQELARRYGAAACDFALTGGVPTAPLTIANHGCPTNYGAQSAAESSAACPPADPKIHALGATPVNVRWSKEVVAVPRTAVERAQDDWAFRWSKSDCLVPFSFQSPSGLRRYREPLPVNEADFNSALTTYQIVPMSGSDPRVLRPDTRYSCAALRDATLRFDGDAPASPPGIGPDSLFTGPQFELTNSAECFGSKLRGEALRLGMNSEAFFVPRARFVDEVQSLSNPGSSCVAYRSTETPGPSTLIARSLPETERPAECVGDPECHRTFVGFESGSGSQVTYDGGIARQWAFNELSAAYPRARMNCPGGDSSPECVRIAVHTANGQAIVTTKLEVPFYFLLGNTATISHRGERRLEREFAGR